MGNNSKARFISYHLLLASGAICLVHSVPVLAQDAQGTSAESASSPDAEIVVTAQKREERLQDVPAAVSVLNTNALASSNQSRLRDYFDSVPGFQASPSPGGGGQQTLVIRGVTSGTVQNPTVGIMIDEVPFGAATYDFSPEVDPADLQRIEVLRGPQGTLYGASSLGGLVKFVTIDPSTSRVSGQVEGGINATAHGDGVGHSLRAALNLPLSETFAVRVSGFTRRDPGYIDNPSLGLKDVNDVTSSGARVTGLWRPTETISVKLAGLYQRTIADGQNEEIRGFGLAPYQTNSIIDTGRTTKTIQAYSATINADLGGIDVTSVTAYSRFKATASQDYTNIAPWGGLASSGFGVPGAPSRLNARVNRLTQELRGTFKTGEAIEWLVGAFYSDEDTLILQKISAQAADGTFRGNIFTYDQPIKFREYALFADPTIRLSDRFSVQLGGRYSWQDARYLPGRLGGTLYPGGVISAESKRKDKVFTYLITPQFKINDDLMVYARVATGYRPGRSNSLNLDPLIPRVAAPDRTTNYEIGLKGSIVPDILSVEFSLYRIDWKDVQLNSISPITSLAFTSNAARARSQGGEFSATLQPGAGFKFASWVSINNAELTRGFIDRATFAPTGARLPFTPKFSANVSADKRFDLSDDLNGSVGVTFTHVGERQGTFVATAGRALYQAYEKVDLRAGLAYGTWGFNVYVRNIGDERGVIGGGPGAFPPSAYVLIQPRSVGASLSKKF